MSDVGRGLPLLSGPAPSNESVQSESCRKCGKEFNILFTRSRKCNHCGYSYCHNCSDYQALMPRSGSETGYDAMNVCGYCIDYLTITAGGRAHLKSLPLSKLRKYVNAYNIKVNRAVEKDDVIDSVLAARGPNGCLPPGNEDYYRKYSVPAANQRPGFRNMFRPTQGQSSNPTQYPPRPPQSPQTSFPRPDLASDTPPPPPPPPPRPQQQQQQYQAPPYPPPPPRPHSAFNNPPPHFHPQFHTPPPPQPPPHPAGGGHGYGYPGYGYQRGFQGGPNAYPGPNPFHGAAPTPPQQASRPPPQQYQQQSRPPPTQQSAPPPPPPPPPRPRPTPTERVVPLPLLSLDELVNMPPENIGALGISQLKSVLLTNHVNAGQVLEKSDLVKKVLTLVEDERLERQRQRQAGEREEMERIQREQERREEQEMERRRREARERDREQPNRRQEGSEQGNEFNDAQQGSRDDSLPRENNPTWDTEPKPTPLPPKAQSMAANLERTGLCVICQDEEANIAIVDCGHLAMCRGCSDLVMASSRECPLCRTRIVTEARLLRIFKT